MTDKTIIFFDGVCEFCSRFVAFVLKRDKKKDFLFSTLQGEAAKKYLDTKDIQSLKSIVVFEKGRLFKESQALKVIFKKLYPHSSFLMVLIPGFIFDKLYQFIAERRYHWFGKKNYKAPQGLEKYFLP